MPTGGVGAPPSSPLPELGAGFSLTAANPDGADEGLLEQPRVRLPETTIEAAKTEERRAVRGMKGPLSKSRTTFRTRGKLRK